MPTLINKSIAIDLLDAVTAAQHTGDTFAMPGVSTLATYQTIFDSAPNSVTILIEGSQDNSTWSTLATTTNVNGASGNITTALPFIRAKISAINAGGCSEVTVILIAKPYAVLNSTTINNPAGTTGQVQFNDDGAFGAIDEGTTGQVLTSNGAGVPPIFEDATGGGITGSIAANQIAVGSGVDEISGSDELTYINGTFVIDVIGASGPAEVRVGTELDANTDNARLLMGVHQDETDAAQFIILLAGNSGNAIPDTTFSFPGAALFEFSGGAGFRMVAEVDSLAQFAIQSSGSGDAIAVIGTADHELDITMSQATGIASFSGSSSYSFDQTINAQGFSADGDAGITNASVTGATATFNIKNGLIIGVS